MGCSSADQSLLKRMSLEAEERAGLLLFHMGRSSMQNTFGRETKKQDYEAGFSTRKLFAAWGNESGLESL